MKRTLLLWGVLVACAITIVVGTAGAGKVAPATVGAGEATIILVRHANKDVGSDPALSEKGRERAKRLGESLRYAGVDALYASDTARARETATIVADGLGLGAASLKPAYDPREKHAVLAQKLLSESAGHVVLVVGHSNTIPPLLKEIGNWDVAEIKTDEDRDFDHVFVVTVSGQGAKRLICAGYPPVAK